VRAWLDAAAAIPSELRLSRAGRGVEGWYDPDGRSDEAEMRKYRGFCRQGDWKWAGDSAGEVGRRLMELGRYADAAVWHAADVACQLLEREKERGGAAHGAALVGGAAPRHAKIWGETGRDGERWGEMALHHGTRSAAPRLEGRL